MRHRPVRSSLVLAACLAAGSVLAACGSDAPSVGAPTNSAVAGNTAPSPSTSQDTGQSSNAPDPNTDTSTDADTDSGQSPSSAPQADGTTVTARDHSFTVSMPDGWKDVIDQVGSIKSIQAAVAESTPTTNVRTNINVVATPSSATDTEQGAKKAAEGYRKQGDIVKMLPKRTIAGEEANGYRKHDASNKRSQTQLFFPHNGTIYAITLTNSPSSLSSANKTLDQFISSWSWS